MIQYIADAHCDFLYGAMEYGYSMDSSVRDQMITLSNLKAGHVALQTFACWTDAQLRTPQLQQCLTMIDCYHRMLENHPELVPLDASFDPSSGKIGCVLTVEGGEPCNGSLAMLRVLYRLGVRAMAFTWNSNNELAGAALGKRQKGLTILGREMVREMNRLRMAVDVAHLSDEGICDVLDISTQPILASHSNARAVFDHPRSLPDSLIREIALQGGLIGVSFYSPQLVKKGRASFRDVAEQIMHIVSVGGIRCCCFGSDFDGMSSTASALRNSSDYPLLCEELIKVGFSEEEVGLIAFGNLFRFFKTIC